MPMLTVASWTYFVLAGIAALLLMVEEHLWFLGAALSLATVGIVLAGIEQVVMLLREIRDALRGTSGHAAEVSSETGDDSLPPVRSLGALDSEIARVRDRFGK
jgi:hypothetical protein